MDKIFAIESGQCYVRIGERWLLCAVMPCEVDVGDTSADIHPTELYTLAEARAKLSGAPAEAPKPVQRRKKGDA